MDSIDIIRVDEKNIDSEHICCAISNEKDCQVVSKKNWMKSRFQEGLVFLKGNVRGKCFIEYVPAENAWVPVDASEYMYIDCLWVSGQFKGKGYSNKLLEACISDSIEKKKRGLVTLSSPKKMAFLADPEFLKYKGFQVADTAAPFYQLMYLPFNKDEKVIPEFLPCAKKLQTDEQGFLLYYTAQCPFTAKYVPILQDLAEQKGFTMKIIKIESTEQARMTPCAWTTFALFYNGNFVTHEILSEKKFMKIMEEL